ncbi:hypothetical protein HID58_015016 [Brassica napus]|uniref:Disease resistance protein n=1 Tax=Brassica napus TaxID=3708 RepID=A0ABQ8DIV5_BRANA|nr:hypothetical protein HID58_015016 [Brassica napus]
MIEKIVNDVSNKLCSTACNDFDDFVGIEAHMKNMNSLLELESERVVMVGIWGPSGVGKTSIGRALFSQLSCQFQGSIFIDKTKEIYTRANSYDYNTKLDLQAQFLSEILDQKDIKVHSLHTMIDRLGQKKVLVVFDDMDDQVLLDAVLGKTRCVGPRSRIVVISKDRELLRACGIESDRIYEVEYPSKELASQMFCRCAFGQDSPPDGFTELASDAVELSRNLPLALNVLGSSLAGLRKEELEERMPKLVNRMAGQGTKSVLGIFLNLREIEDELSISEEAFSGMKNLRFLRIYGVSEEDKETILQLRGGKNRRRRQLGLRKWYWWGSMHLQEGKNHIWRQLRLLEWWGCSMTSMPLNFRAENLVELRMPDSQLHKLWEGVEVLKSLKTMDLRRSKHLKVFPDLSKATNLEELYLEDCCSLVTIPSSIRSLKKLRKLDMKRCTKLRDLPANIDLESLHSLNFSGCSQLRSFPHISRNISHLFLDETKIEEVPERIEDISRLSYVSMKVDNHKQRVEALTVLNQLKGYYFPDCDSEAEIIQKMADDISFALNITPKEYLDVVGATMPSSLNQETGEALYDRLDWNEKVLFRHIACFLNNKTYENVMRLLEDSELDVGSGLNILLHTSLIRISEKRVIRMKPVLQKLGRNIVLRPFINQPAKRQFLMDTSEGCDVLIDQTGNERMFVISFKVSETSKRDERFRGMKKLQFLRMFKKSLYGKQVRVHLVKGLFFVGMT